MFLKKRKEYNYPDMYKFTSSSSTDTLVYPVNKMFICENDSIDYYFLKEYIEEYAVDFIFSRKHENPVRFLCVSFHNYNDCNNFLNATELTFCLDIKFPKQAWTTSTDLFLWYYRFDNLLK